MSQPARRGRHGLYPSPEAEMESQDWLGRHKKLSGANLAENPQINTAGIPMTSQPHVQLHVWCVYGLPLESMVLDRQRGKGCEDTSCRPLISQCCPGATVSRSPPLQHWQVMTPPPPPVSPSGGSCTPQAVCVLSGHRAMPLLRDLLWLSSTADCLPRNGIFWLPPGVPC